MDYLKIDGEDFSVFDICQAHQQLESDYNVDGIVWERPSNRRRNESAGCQLARIGYRDAYRWVDICNPSEEDDCGDDQVRYIYLSNVMNWGLPADTEMLAVINRIFVADWLQKEHPAYYLKDAHHEES